MYNYKVPCDILICECLEEAIKNGREEDVHSHIVDELQKDGFDYQHSIARDKVIRFKVEPDLVVLWCYARTMHAAKAIVDYVAYHGGEDPSFLYDRIIHRV